MTTVRKGAGELEGAALNWAVAKSRYSNFAEYNRIGAAFFICLSHPQANWRWISCNPVLDWVQAGELMEKYDMSLWFDRARAKHVRSQALCDREERDKYGILHRVSEFGPTRQIAICRAVVSRFYPDGIDVPAELL